LILLLKSAAESNAKIHKGATGIAISVELKFVIKVYSP
jgi:hypothetical protein